MPRKLRYVPPGGFLIEAGLRCQEARLYLRPSRRLNRLIIGVLARAQRQTSIQVIGVVVLSNHIHLNLWAKDTEQLSDFMEYVGGNVAREVNRLLGRRGPFWESRYTDILVAPEEAVQVARLKYFLEQGCKEGLVSSPRQWPGIHLASALLSGRPLEGIWVDRSGFYNAGRGKGKPPRLVDFEEPETLELAPLPCWAHLSKEQYRRRVRELVEEIEKETADRHRAAGTRPAGRRAVLRKSPFHKPESPKRRPAPLVLAATKEARQRIRTAYREFVQKFRAAAEHLKEANPELGFPEGAFPSDLPFVRGRPILQPG
jgi:REP-associated tyrosine transposase